MCAKCKNEAARIFLIFWCLFAFISCGYEHSIANMTIFGVSLFSAHPDTVTWGGFAYNMLPVTLGNIIGGGFFGLVYWYATYVPEKALVPDGDGGRSVRLTETTRPDGLVVIGEDENENEIYGKLPSQS
jgi:hypothetical protein